MDFAQNNVSCCSYEEGWSKTAWTGFSTWSGIFPLKSEQQAIVFSPHMEHPMQCTAGSDYAWAGFSTWSGIFPQNKSEQPAIARPPRRKCHQVRELFWGGALKEISGERKKRGVKMKNREKSGRRIGMWLMQRKYLHHRCIDDTFRGGGEGGGVGFTIGA